MPRKELQQIDREYSEWEQMVPQYLIECCLRYELACSNMSDADFKDIMMDLDAHWDEISHHYKHLLRRSCLRKLAPDNGIIFPTLIRSAACRIASTIPSSPMYGKGFIEISQYCLECTGKNFNV